MPTRLTREIAELRSRLLDMATIVAEQFTDAVEALMTHDEALAEQVVVRDREVDRLELEVDKSCERIMARHQPVATDLRTLLTVEKINTDLERIGDHCRNVARNTKHVTEVPSILNSLHLRKMSETARRMLDDAKQAFLDQDADLARRIPELDDEVDRLHEKNFQALVEYIQEHPEHAEVAAHLITASKAVERISDHSINIAKGVVFLIEGVDIRHAGVQEASTGDGEVSSR
ncbi:phosphate transport system regulatory protein PhoU [Salinibacter sp. 10B]|uniref:phosphate signaling complex protein PhoU n=1 Tax=Salinibacter sp. 10B TaxID=1923971 RepID=UPI000CF47122|nr:phosphate signaling complex protein PhoU [Salinibacter sp. 10B]PQJ34469.1 phosphate transport system regulatory protein PhoU [Salinibacter sp. 10B]